MITTHTGAEDCPKIEPRRKLACHRALGHMGACLHFASNGTTAWNIPFTSASGDRL